MNKIFFFLRGFKDGMHQFGQTISIIINSGLLLIVYFIGIGFTSIIAKMSRKHFLDTDISKNEKSYWTDLNLKKKSIKEYHKQF